MSNDLSVQARKWILNSTNVTALVSHWSANAAQGQCCSTVNWTSGLTSVLHSCCNQAGEEQECLGQGKIFAFGKTPWASFTASEASFCLGVSLQTGQPQGIPKRLSEPMSYILRVPFKASRGNAPQITSERWSSPVLYSFRPDLLWGFALRAWSPYLWTAVIKINM